jgi:hypothetical protein
MEGIAAPHEFPAGIIRLRGDKETKPLPFLDTPKAQRCAEFSPDSNYVAYASDESGRYESGDNR